MLIKNQINFKVIGEVIAGKSPQNSDKSCILADGGDFDPPLDPSVMTISSTSIQIWKIQVFIS